MSECVKPLVLDMGHGTRRAQLHIASDQRHADHRPRLGRRGRIVVRSLSADALCRTQAQATKLVAEEFEGSLGEARERHWSCDGEQSRFA